MKEVVDAWLLSQQTQQLEGSFWQGAVASVREVGSEILHLLFYMPASEVEKLQAVLAAMWTGDKETARHTFQLMHSAKAITALETMLSEQGLDPDDFTLSTAWLGKKIYISLQRGELLFTHASSILEIHHGAVGLICLVALAAGSNGKLDPQSPVNTIPAISSISLWTSGVRTAACHASL